eukprot:GHVH01004401.1.p1 GENE.GHVH01004401.1~~GHVH01004401.1.p1  ORF type:complete len:791 (+),score=128.43 GHVH01004401.1:543-2915(+)
MVKSGVVNGAASLKDDDRYRSLQTVRLNKARAELNIGQPGYVKSLTAAFQKAASSSTMDPGEALALRRSLKQDTTHASPEFQFETTIAGQRHRAAKKDSLRAKVELTSGIARPCQVNGNDGEEKQATWGAPSPISLIKQSSTEVCEGANDGEGRIIEDPQVVLEEERSKLEEEKKAKKVEKKKEAARVKKAEKKAAKKESAKKVDEERSKKETSSPKQPPISPESSKRMTPPVEHVCEGHAESEVIRVADGERLTTEVSSSVVQTDLRAVYLKSHSTVGDQFRLIERLYNSCLPVEINLSGLPQNKCIWLILAQTVKATIGDIVEASNSYLRSLGLDIEEFDIELDDKSLNHLLTIGSIYYDFLDYTTMIASGIDVLRGAPNFKLMPNTDNRANTDIVFTIPIQPIMKQYKNYLKNRFNDLSAVLSLHDGVVPSDGSTLERTLQYFYTWQTMHNALSKILQNIKNPFCEVLLEKSVKIEEPVPHDISPDLLAELGLVEISQCAQQVEKAQLELRKLHVDMRSHGHDEYVFLRPADIVTGRPEEIYVLDDADLLSQLSTKNVEKMRKNLTDEWGDLGRFTFFFPIESIDNYDVRVQGQLEQVIECLGPDEMRKIKKYRTCHTAFVVVLAKLQNLLNEKQIDYEYLVQMPGSSSVSCTVHLPLIHPPTAVHGGWSVARKRSSFKVSLSQCDFISTTSIGMMNRLDASREPVAPFSYPFRYPFRLRGLSSILTIDPSWETPMQILCKRWEDAVASHQQVMAAKLQKTVTIKEDNVHKPNRGSRKAKNNTARVA